LTSDLNNVNGNIYKVKGEETVPVTTQFFELELQPTKGAAIGTLDSTALATLKNAVTVQGASIAITSVTQISRTNRFRFYFTYTFAAADLRSAGNVTVTLAKDAFTDDAGNKSAAASVSFSVRKPASTFFIELDG